MDLVGYQVTERMSGAAGRAQVFRAFRRSDGQRVVLKTPAPGTPQATLDRYRTEHELIQKITHPRVVRSFELVTGPTGPVLVLEQAEGITLAELIRTQPLTLVDRLRLAIQLADAVAAVQDARVVHLDVNPSNVVVDLAALQLKLIDFGIGTDLEREVADPVAPGRLRGTLAYIAPEQTGRTSRTVDERADQYGLGATLYELFTGRLPFTSPDPLELVHHHVARVPEPPHEVERSLPPSLSRIIARLLEKNPEDRYGSAAGVLADLTWCLADAESGRRSDFAIGHNDVPSRFRIPERLYGRDAELTALHAAFDQLDGERSVALFVGGYSGVGKTRLVAEVRRPLARRGGYFAAGKFDQFKRDVPFASLHAALRDLVRQILTEGADALAGWKAALKAAVGDNGALLVAWIPEVEAILGAQAPVADLPPREAEVRFSRLLKSFVRVFADPAHPLVLFLDDLQWVDSATVAWLESTLADPHGGSLLLIGAYRDNEVPPSHPLAEALARLAPVARIGRIDLLPLSPTDTNAIVADTLHMEPASCAELSAILHGKTGGNPFFLGQTLRSLYARGAIGFDSKRRGWRYDLDQVAAAGLTDNVIELMVERLSSLPGPTQEVLKLAACVGSRFRLDTLQVISAAPAHELRDALRVALREGYLLQASRWSEGDGAEYRFQHDRVQQAAFSMMSDAEVAALRPKIGWSLFESLASADADELFDVLQHLNPDRAALPADRRSRVAELNARAASRARRSTAYATALTHADIAIELSGESFELVLERALCAHLCGREAEAERGFVRALELAGSDADRARAHEARVHFYTDRARFAEAYEAGREGASAFGVSMPKSFIPPALIFDFLKVKWHLRGKKIGDMARHAQMTDPRMLAAGRLIAASLKAAYQVRPELCVHNAARLVDLCVLHGNFDDSPVAWLVLGSIFQGGVMGNHAAGFDWGQLALELVERFQNGKQRAEVNFVYGYFAHSWTKPMLETEEHFRRAWRAAVDSGDNFHAGCACSGIVQNMWMRGVPLAETWAETERFVPFLEGIKAPENLGTVHAVRQAIRYLRGETTSSTSLSSDGFDEAAFEATLPSFGSPHFAHFWHVDKIAVLYLRGEYDEAARVAEASRKFASSSTGMQHAAEQMFYEGMLAAARKQSYGPLKAARKKFAAYALRNPVNFASRYELLDAEWQRIRGNRDAAMAAYDRAVEAASRDGFLQHQALALELGGRFLLEMGNRWNARGWLAEAASAWRHFGATTLADRLEQQNEGLQLTTTRTLSLPGARSTSTITTGGGKTGTLSVDLGAVTKAGLLLAAEVHVGKLLERLVEVVIENVGAERGVLILPRDGRFVVEAEGRVGQPPQVLQGIPMESHGGLPLALINLVARTRQPHGFDDARDASLLVADPYVAAQQPKSVLCVPVVHAAQLKGLLYLENNLSTGAFTKDRSTLLELISGQIAVSLENATLVSQLEEKVRERTRALEHSNALIRQTFGRYLSDDIVESLLAAPENLSFGGERRTVTVLMCDLRGFSSLAEGLEPERVVALLNNYLSTMTHIIGGYRGTIDEFIGDAILVIFGAPFVRPDDAERAVACAIAMQRAMTSVNDWNVARGLPEVEMGIGINTGEVVLGNIGSERRAKYAVVGSTVNLASRVEGYTVGGQVLISQGTRDAITVPVRIGAQTVVQPKGVRAPITIHEVLGIGGDHAIELQGDRDDMLPADGLRVRYRVMSGKDVAGTLAEAVIRRVSARGATIRAERVEKPLTDLHLRLVDGDDEIDADVYAKVIGASDEEGGFSVRFTSLPTVARQALQAHLGAK